MRTQGTGAFVMIRGLIVLKDGTGGWKWFGKKVVGGLQIAEQFYLH